MRLVLVFLFLFSSIGLAGPKKPPEIKAPPLFQGEVFHGDRDCRLALSFLAKVGIEDRPFFRFFSFTSVPETILVQTKILFNFYLNTVSHSRVLVPVYEVPGSDGRLVAVDLRKPRWNVPAFSAVARRDVTFREPHISHVLAEGLRRQAGIIQDPKTFHVEVIVPAPWFVREIMESDRSPSYYDLLYARERFGENLGVVPADTATVLPEDPGPAPIPPKPIPWPGGVWPADGKFYPKDSFPWIVQEEQDAYEAALKAWKEKKEAVELVPDLPKGNKFNGEVKKDFPADVNDWNKKWGIQAVQDYLNAEKIFIARGEVVAGAKSDRLRGSYVSYNDRIITILRVPTGVAMRTYDSLKTAMKKNFANFPKEATIGDVPFDAGELLAHLPNGLQAAMLIDGAGKRVEFGDPRAVRNTLDPFDVTVHNQIDCVTCHGPQYGVIAPSNQKVKEAIARGNRLLAQDPEVQEQIEAFFEDFSDTLDEFRSPYKKVLKKITAVPGNANGWTGDQLSKENLSFRDWYDFPVGLDQAAAELGVSRAAVVMIALMEGSIDAGNLALEQPIPRDVWDADLFPKLALILSAVRTYENPDPAFEYFFPELLRQVTEEDKKLVEAVNKTK